MDSGEDSTEASTEVDIDAGAVLGLGSGGLSLSSGGDGEVGERLWSVRGAITERL